MPPPESAGPPPASLALSALGIPHRVFVHQGPVASLEQAAAERGQRPDQVVRSILFRVQAGAYLLVLVAGPSRLDWKALRSYLGRSRVTMASPEEVLSVTGYQIGAVAPVGLPRPLRVLVESGLLVCLEVSIGSGVRGTAVILERDDLLAALGDYEVVVLRGEDRRP